MTDRYLDDADREPVRPTPGIVPGHEDRAEQIRKVRRQMVDVGEQNAREQDIAASETAYERVMSFFAIVTPCGWNSHGEVVRWRAKTLEKVDPSRGANELVAIESTPEKAVHELRFKLAESLRADKRMDWELCKELARKASFACEVIRDPKAVVAS
jgi:hypothetical protein